MHAATHHAKMAALALTSTSILSLAHAKTDTLVTFKVINCSLLDQYVNFFPLLHLVV